MLSSKVEILMATYNGEKYIKEQIESIISQTYEEWNLLIRDDGSIDKTLEIIKEFEKNDKRIKILKDSKGNLGYIKNFEELLRNSRAEYIFLCDQDDIWRKDKLEKSLLYLKNKSVIIHNAKILYSEKLKNRYKEKLEFRNKSLISRIVFPEYTGCCMGLRKEFLKIVLPIPNGFPSHDIWIGMLAEIKKDIYYLNEELIDYRRHLQNVSATGEKSKNSLLKKLKFRIYNFFFPYIRLIMKRG